MRRAVGITLLVLIANSVLLRQAGDPRFWLAPLACYLLLTIFSLRSFLRQGTLRQRLVPRGGDVSLGALAGLALLAAFWLLRGRFVPPGSARTAWLFQIYAWIGPVEGHGVKTLGLLALVAMEEIVWRGVVTSDVKAQLGARRTLPVSASLYALTYLPTTFALADPVAGPNPLLLLTALGSGLLWTFIAVRTDRLVAVFVSHAVFVYFACAPLLMIS